MATTGTIATGTGPGVLRHGTVVEFDEAVGLGAVRAHGAPAEAGEPGEAGDSYRFHCTQIADGSRTIEVGTAVTFSVVAGRLGAWEAADVRLAG